MQVLNAALRLTRALHGVSLMVDMIDSQLRRRTSTSLVDDEWVADCSNHRYCPSVVYIGCVCVYVRVLHVCVCVCVLETALALIEQQKSGARFVEPTARMLQTIESRSRALVADRHGAEFRART